MAIKLFQEALDKTPALHLDKTSRLESLGLGHYTRYQKTESIADLDRAIELFEDAIDRTPAYHPERAQRLQCLGSGYLGRYYSVYIATGSIRYLDEAIRLFEEALDTTPANHPQRASRLEILGAAYRSRCQAIGEIGKFRASEIDKAKLDTAIQLYREALDRNPEDYAERTRLLEDLRTVYRAPFTATGVDTELDKVIQLYQEALDHSLSPAAVRLALGITLLKLQADSKDWLEASQTASKTVSLIPLLTPRSLYASDKQRLLVRIYGLASDAAAAALNSKKTPFDAIQLLELGRGVIAESFNEIRADISELRQKYPQFAQEYIDLRDQLNISENPIQCQVDQLYNIGLQLEKMIQRIRVLPGFERFFLAPSEDELKSAAEYGPIVVINISIHRCDALIIESSGLQSLELPRLHTSDIRDRITENLAAPKILEWLWETVAQPVLDTLGFTKSPSDSCWPRIWWIPTGQLSKFPLHAAVRHTDGSVETVLDRVISSYSSSIKAVIHGRRQRQDLEDIVSNQSKALLVAIEHTPGAYSRLPFATREVEILRDLCPSMELEPMEPGRRKQDVMSCLPQCDIFHFAGHCFTDNDDPLKSYLLLEDGNNNALTVANLLDLNLRERSPFLAYLSACGTGRIKSEMFIDESIHLISACQLAGHRHVIGTLWEVKDDICVEIARITYEAIRDRGMTDESVCWGLHMAARKLRNRWLSMPVEARRRTKLAKEDDSISGVDKGGTYSTYDRDQRDDRLPRDIISCDDDDKEVGLWVPYVHIGV
jgi:tetratricopeptide (TPR) repeat protein